MPNRTTAINLGLMLALSAVAAADDAARLMVDGFELGDVSSWSAVSGGPLPATPTAFRLDALILLDPHLYGDPLDLGLCSDVTPLLNLEIANSIGQDEDLDGCFDFSGLLLFRPLEQMLNDQTVDQRGGLCRTESTVCRADTEKPAHRLLLDNQASGTCLGALPGTTSGASPVDDTAAPCFVTAATDTTIDFGPGFTLPLRAVQIAGHWNDEPADRIGSGLLRGFLRASDAAAVTPPGGTQPLTAYLRGGDGNCAAGDDRDDLDGEIGWWIYASFEAGHISWQGL